MGQRTAILLKKNFGNNRSTISLIHHQWGIGKTMPAYLTQEILKSVFPTAVGPIIATTGCRFINKTFP